MSFLDHLQSLHESVEDLFEQVELTTTEELLDEAVEKFADIPAVWKKKFSNAYDGKAGENSEITIKTTGRIKNKSALTKVLKDTLTTVNDKNETAGAIIEIENKPAAAIFRSDDKKFNFVTDAGVVKRIVRSRRSYNKYTSHNTYQFNDSTLGIQETIEKIERLLTDAAVDVTNGQTEDESKHVKHVDLVTSLSLLNVTIKIVAHDKVRAEISASRKDNKNIDTDSLKANRRTTITKYTKEHIKPLYDDIQKSIPKFVDIDDLLLRAANGERVKIDLKDVKENLDNLNYVLNAFADAYKEGKIRSGWKNELDWDMKYLSDAIKKIKK